MVLRQLVYLVALAREGHFRRAAEACRVSQPGLSAALRQLEEELGVPIIARSQRFKGFTPEGEIVLQWARRILADCDSLKQELVLRVGGLSGHLVIGGIPSAMPLLPVLSGTLCRRFPGISIEALTLTESQIEKGLAEFEIHVGLTFLGSVTLPKLRTMQLYKERYVFLTPCDGPFAERKTLNWAEAASVPLCLLSKDIKTREIVDRLFRRHGCSPAPQIETNSILANCAHVCAGYWSTIMPEAFLYPFGVPRGTVAVEMADPEEVQEVGLVTVERDPFPPLVQGLLDIAAEVDITAELARTVELGNPTEPRIRAAAIER